MTRLAQIWRYPLKSIGRERLSRARLDQGGKIPGDRAWAVLHEGAANRLNEAGRLESWLPKMAFLRGAAGPSLQAIEGGMDGGKLALRHPDAGEIAIDPANEDDAARLIDWLRPLWPEGRPAPLRLVAGLELVLVAENLLDERLDVGRGDDGVVRVGAPAAFYAGVSFR